MNKLLFKLFLAFHQLLNQGVFSSYFFFENLNHIVFRVEHVLKIASQSIKAIMRIPLGFFFYDTHATFTAGVSACTLTALMVYYVHSFYFYTTVNTWHENVWTDSLMLFDVSSYTLLLAFSKRFTFCGSELAYCIVVLNFLVR
jgi:hypothetical protein